MEKDKIVIIGDIAENISAEMAKLAQSHNLEIEIVHPDSAPSFTQPKPIEPIKIVNTIFDSIVFYPPLTRKQRRAKERNHKKNRS